jgi:hypothetical protein
MNKVTHLLLAGAVGLALCDMGRAQEAPPQSPADAPVDGRAIAEAVLAQETLPPPIPGSPESGVGSGVIEALPRPRDTPRSLFGPEQPPSKGGIQIDAPYFVPDPLLDFSQSAPPGWFVGAEVQIVKPHLSPNLIGSTVPGHYVPAYENNSPIGPKATDLNIPSAPLDWTGSPRVFAGYRLPSGFGEFMVAYRHLGTTGSGSVPDTNGPISLNTRFAFDILDLDYNSRELSTFLGWGPQWDMKFSLGLRQMFLFYGLQGDQPFSQASAGSGIAFAQATNNVYGIGPHAALELSRSLGKSGFSLYSRADFGMIYGDVWDQWNTVSNSLGANGRPLRGQTNSFGHQQIPMINFRSGLTWKPAPTSGARLFVGYQYEVFWDLNRLPQFNSTPYAPPSLGQYQSQGIVLQGSLNW